jgi:hypothetical protein
MKWLNLQKLWVNLHQKLFVRSTRSLEDNDKFDSYVVGPLFPV